MKVILIICLLIPVFAQKYPCSIKSAALILKRPTYEFSVSILDKVAEEMQWHFVFSPMSTWLQLVALAEGARGRTRNEIWKVTKHHRVPCFRRKLQQILNSVYEELNTVSKKRSLMVIDKLLNVKSSFKQEIEKWNSFKVLSLDFADPDSAAATVNQLIALHTNGLINEVVSADDFTLTVFLMIDTAIFKSDWRTPFNPVYTSVQPFFSEEGAKIGDVNMMYQTSYFNVSTIPYVNMKVLELPCANDRISMLVLLPTKGTMKDLFLTIKEIRFMTIFNIFKSEGEKLVNVRLPRFKLNTDIDNIPELISDMGLRTIFDPNVADFKHISDYKLFASLMMQITNMQVTEAGVAGAMAAEFLVSYTDQPFIHFDADRPFAFVIVDKITEILLYAGMYSEPSVY